MVRIQSIRTIALTLMSGALLIPRAATAQNLYVVHAIPGTALGLEDDTLAVDVAVDGGCAFTDVQFGDFAPTDVPVGSYEATISLSDGACTGAAAIVDTFTVSFSETAVVVAHLNAAGAPTLTKIAVDASPTDTRITYLHGAGAPPVRIESRITGGKQDVARLSNGEATFPLEGSAGPLKVAIRGADDGSKLFRAKGVEVAGNLLIIAAGTLATDTFQPVIVPIGGE